MKINFILVFTILLGLPITVYASEVPGDWWGVVSIDGMKSSNAAVVSAYINGQLKSTTTVGDLKSNYYLIHIEGQVNDIVYFKVNGFNVSQEPQNWSSGDHQQLNLSLTISATAEKIYEKITRLKNETLSINKSDSTGTSLDISFKQDVSNVSLTIRKVETNPTNKSIGDLKSVNKFVFIESDNISEAMDSAVFKVYYTDSDVQGLNESSLTLNYWNETIGNWITLISTVNSVDNYVETNITHFSLYGVFGSSETVSNNAAPSTPSSGGGSSGGGGGGSSSGGSSSASVRLCTEVDYECTDWSECTDGSQVRTCNKKSGIVCNGDASPYTAQTCENKLVTTSNEIDQTQTNDSKNPSPNGITGLAVGGGTSPILLVVVSIVAAMGFVVYRRGLKN